LFPFSFWYLFQWLANIKFFLSWQEGINQIEEKIRIKYSFYTTGSGQSNTAGWLPETVMAATVWQQ